MFNNARALVLRLSLSRSVGVSGLRHRAPARLTSSTKQKYQAPPRGLGLFAASDVSSRTSTTRARPEGRHLTELPLLSQLAKPLPCPMSPGTLPVVYHPEYSAPVLRDRHTFPMQVFRRIHQRLLSRGIIVPSQVVQPRSLPTLQELLLVHTPEYVEGFLSGTLPEETVRRIGFHEVTNSKVLVERTLWECAGTMLTARLALEFGLAVNTAGGTHHAHPAFGSGFCLINDLAVTAEALLQVGKVDRVLVVDTDVHQGDGTAAAFEGRSDVRVLDIHSAKNFPYRKQAAHTSVGLSDGVGDGEYLAILGDHLNRELQEFSPDLVLYDAGVDTHVDDSLGRLALTDQGLRDREMLVLDTCLSEGIPIAGFVGGGYDPCLDTLADRHIYLHQAAKKLWQEYLLGEGSNESADGRCT